MSMKGFGFYILDENGEPTLVDDVLTWGKWFERNPGARRVAWDRVGDVEISTVFLGIDHSSSRRGSAVRSRTMIFGGEHDEWQQRAATRAEALLIHAEAIALVRGPLWSS